MLLKKGQISIEVLIVILFLIAFIYVYNTLAEQTVYSLEISKIKEQEQDIALSLNEFLQLQRNVLNYNPTEIINYHSSYKIPEISLASRRAPCKINLSSTSINIDVNSDWIVSYDYGTSLPGPTFTLPSEIMCGHEISCILQSNKIVCN